MRNKFIGELTELGTFELTGTVLRVSDPCYDRDVWCSETLENCKPGTWETVVFKRDEGDWGNRIVILIARHEESSVTLDAFREVASGKDKTWRECPFNVAVDSGQAGIFDEFHYQDDSIFDEIPEAQSRIGADVWYRHCCDITLSSLGAGVLPYGVVSSSGFGDGVYLAYHHTDKEGKTDSVLIVFIED